MTVIQLKRSNTTGNAPASLSPGELAINEADSNFFYRGSGGAVTKRALNGLQLIAQGTVTNAASLTVNVDPAFVGVYKQIIAYLFEARPANDNAHLYLRLGDSDGIDSAASDYDNIGWHVANAAAIYTSDQVWTGGAIGLAYWYENSTGYGSDSVVQIGSNESGLGQHNRVLSKTVAHYIGDGFPILWTASAKRNAAINLTQFQIAFSSGNIATMKYAIHGIP